MTMFAHIRNWLRLARVDHWVKNGLVLFPPFFLGNQAPASAWEQALPALVSFSLVSSAVYVLNDWFDREHDRLHPRKCARPIASGAVSSREALILAAALAAAGFAMVPAAYAPALSFATLGLYFACNLAYSLRLKHVPIVDVFTLASGFVFRIFYGGFFFGVGISSWLFLCVFASALYFAIGKRRNELRQMGEGLETRPVLKLYTQRFLDAHYYVFCALSILFYCLWTISRTDQRAVGKLALTIPIVIFILIRYNLLMDSDKCDGDPVSVLLHDKWLLASVTLFMSVNFVLLFFGAELPRIVYYR